MKVKELRGHVGTEYLNDDAKQDGAYIAYLDDDNVPNYYGTGADDFLTITGNKVTNASGFEIDFDAAVNLMDDDLREKIHGTVDTEQEFFTAYEKAHEKKYGEPWELSKANPTW